MRSYKDVLQNESGIRADRFAFKSTQQERPKGEDEKVRIGEMDLKVGRARATRWRFLANSRKNDFKTAHKTRPKASRC